MTKDLAKHREAANKATAAATKKRGEAAKTKSDSTRRMATSAAEREEKKVADATKKIGEIEKKYADNTKAIGAKESSLRSALITEQRVADREVSRRRQTEKSHAREMAALSRPNMQIRYVEVQPPKQEPLRVLYLTANPESVETTVEHPDGSIETSGVWLRVDFEVRQVKEMLKKSKYRDLVTVEHLPAATTMDLLEGLNDHRPHVVHFSGHANSWGLFMGNDEGTTEGDDLDFDLLARLLGATDEPPRLVVLNACESLAGADALLQTVPVVVGMSDKVNDASAVVFAARFYSGIASAQSVDSSLKQAKVAMEAAALEGSHLPEARAREDVDLATLILVKHAA
ncbi:MAG: CHAT domain-containing protein [Humibacillus sp.]|nr:CHAT domain-containing protein [Humibacillus sp.]MDN5779058.1 CHAT domain-containing protein [Humibacillus sp.]